MFQWVRTGQERYYVNVGDHWGGVVWPVPASIFSGGKAGWAGEYTVAGKPVRGNTFAAVFDTQELAMDYVEDKISKALRSVRQVQQSPFRKIYNSLDEMGERGESYLDYLRL